MALHQIVDGGRMDIDAGDRTAPEGSGDRLVIRSAMRRACPLDPGRKSLGRQPAILAIQYRAEDDDLSVKGALEIILVVLQRAGAQIGKGKGRDVVRAALEVDGHRVRHLNRNLVASERNRSI